MMLRKGRQNGTPSTDGGYDTEARVGVTQRLLGGAGQFPAAQRMRERLLSAGLPADRVIIVGRDHSPVDQPADQRSSTRAAARGAVPGLLVGALVGWLLRVTEVVVSDVPLGGLTVAAALLGATLGAVIAVVGYGLRAVRRVETGRTPMKAGRFELLIDADLADRAARLLRETPQEPYGVEAADDRKRPAA
jgi:hypothetical protein